VRVQSGVYPRDRSTPVDATVPKVASSFGATGGALGVTAC